jgi:hypothetical protein
VSERAPGYQRSFSGMVGAMIVLVLVVLAFVGFRAATRGDAAREVEPVDVQGPTEFARESVDFTVLSPTELPDGWIATSVRLDGGRDPAWHVGVLTDEERYIGLEQADRSVGDMVEQHVGEDAVDEGEVSVADRSWTVYRDETDDDLALVSEEPDVVSVIVGSVDQVTLTAYAELVSAQD